jgi:transcriptional regulator with PAS, ATPase and Fis domain
MKRISRRCPADASVLQAAATDLADPFGSDALSFGSVGSKAHNAEDSSAAMPAKNTIPIVVAPAAEPPSMRTAPQVQALVSFLEHEAQPMIVLDPEYNILAANTAYQRQFGTTDKPYIGHKCFRVSHHYDLPCDQAGEHCPMKKAFELKGPDRVLHIHHTPRGPEHVDVELRPILDAQREVVAYVERLTTVRSASARPSSDGLVGGAPAFNAVLSAVQRVGPSMLPVLLLGESGTGKELFARAVHEASPRAHGPFVVVDCSGLTETLFESELFGYEKGAFTGANARKPGLVETAKGGTLFLDEMGDVPLSMQVKLLRLIESGTFRRVGAIESQQSDFRLVAATHKPLQQMVADGRFRQDLFYRISAFPIQLPPLRERVADIPMLVDSFLQRSPRGDGAKHRVTVEPEAMARMQAHDWPGNIRELRNVLDRARLFADDGVVRAEHLPESLRPGSPRPVWRGLGGQSPGGMPPSAAARRGDIDDDELKRLAESSKVTRKALARQAGLSERTLYRRLKALGLA